VSATAVITHCMVDAFLKAGLSRPSIVVKHFPSRSLTAEGAAQDNFDTERLRF